MADDELKMRLVVDDKEAKKKLEQFKEQAEEVGETVEEEIEEKASSSFSALAFKLGALGTVGGLVVKGIQAANDGFASLQEKAQHFDSMKFMTGVGAERLQKIANGLQIAGVGVESFVSSFQSMNNLISGKAWGSFANPDLIRAFDELGITNPDQYEDPLELLMKTAEELNKLTDIGERNRLSKILNVDQNFLYGLKEGAEEYSKISGHSEETLKRMRETNKELRQLDTQLGLAKERFGEAIAPFKEWWLERKIGFFNNIADFLGVGMGETGGFGKMDLPANANANRQKMANILKAEGFSDVGINAILGNAQQESSFNPHAENKGHYGLFQWDRNRQKQLRGFKNWGDVEGQMNFAIYEMKQRGIYEALKNANNLEEAVALFEKKFEVSGGQDMAKRFRYAGVPENMIQGAMATYYPQLAGGDRYQTFNIAVQGVKEAQEFVMGVSDVNATQTTVYE